MICTQYIHFTSFSASLLHWCWSIDRVHHLHFEKKPGQVQSVPSSIDKMKPRTRSIREFECIQLSISNLLCFTITHILLSNAEVSGVITEIINIAVAEMEQLSKAV